MTLRDRTITITVGAAIEAEDAIDLRADWYRKRGYPIPTHLEHALAEISTKLRAELDDARASMDDP